MLPKELSPKQKALVEAPFEEATLAFVSGPAGAGKSSVLTARLIRLLEEGVPAYAILVLLPDRRVREVLRQELQGVHLGPYGHLSLHTYYSLAQRMVALFWPLVARPAGFAHPERPPIFLTYELAQYHLGRVIIPLLEQGYFEGLHLHPQRLLSQLLDNLNKAALNGYVLDEVILRLRSAWRGPSERVVAFQQAQECVERFRKDCLERGLLDLSLTVEVFHQLLDTPPFWGYFSERYQHLLVDNVEESVPAAQDFIARMLPHCESAMLVYDQGGGYRTLLGADPEGAISLRLRCNERVQLDVPSLPTEPLAAAIAVRLGQDTDHGVAPERAILDLVEERYRSEMISGAAAKLAEMVHDEGIACQEIVVLVPYLDGVLRFALAQECDRLDVPLRILRRYRRPAEEPAVRALLTLAAILYPEWDLSPHRYDVAEALGQALVGLDPIRAALLAEWAYDPTGPALHPPDALVSRSQARLEPALYEGYRSFWTRWERVWPAISWPWERFLAHLMGQVLPEALQDPRVAVACAELLESARRFRHVWPVLHGEEDEVDVGRHYLDMLRRGLVTAQYLVREEKSPPAVLVAPAHSYLLTGRPVRRQFWLDVGSMDWWVPPQQPLTNPYVLSRRWPLGEPWGDAADYAIRQATLARVVQGLCHRCTEGIVLCRSELSTSGQVQDSPLLRALESILRRRDSEE
jgi:hypothetical protein